MKYLILFVTIFSFTTYAQNFSFNKETGKAVPNFVGELKLLKGRVLRTTGGRPRVVQVGEKFYPKDIVVTEANSMMKLLMVDDTWLSLGPESEIVFTDFDFKDKNNRTINYELKRGQLAANVRQKIKDGGVSFRTRFTAMGIRGTKILMNYREFKGSGISEYAVMEGEAEVTSSKGEAQKLTSGERIVLIENEKTKEELVERLKLTAEDLENFSSPEGEEEKGIKPLMPYYEPKAVSVTSTDIAGEKVERKQDGSSSGNGTLNNLKKLNEQLKDNQKRRR